MRSLLLVPVLLLAVSCNKDASQKKQETVAPAAAPVPETVPTDPIALRTYLLGKIPTAIEKTTCTCCNKSLGQCFRETLGGQGPRCPVGCANCLIQGRVALAVKQSGGSDEEAATRSVRVSRGLEQPPAGVSLSMPHHNHADHEGHSH